MRSWGRSGHRLSGWCCPAGRGGDRIAVMLAILVSLTLCSPSEGLIAYVSGAVESEQRVLVLDLSTGDSRPVGPGRADGAPRWSRDGRWLAFETATEAGTGIYVVRPDGLDGRYLDHGENVNREPRWSRDGSMLAYSVGEGLERQIAVYELATDREEVWGGERTSLMRPVWLRAELAGTLAAPGVDRGSLLSGRIFGEGKSDELALAAVGLTGGPGSMTTDLFLVTRTETIPFPRVALPGKGRYAEWSAEPLDRAFGIAYESDDGGDREIFVYTRRGVADVTNHRAADWNPVWGPEGNWIAFESFRDGRRGVYRVHRDTRSTRRPVL